MLVDVTPINAAKPSDASHGEPRLQRGGAVSQVASTPACSFGERERSVKSQRCTRCQASRLARRTFALAAHPAMTIAAAAAAPISELCQAAKNGGLPMQ